MTLVMTIVFWKTYLWQTYYDFCNCVAFLTKCVDSIDFATFLYAVVGIYINTMKTAFLFNFWFLQALFKLKAYM